MGALALGGRYSVIPFTLIRHPQQQVHEVVWVPNLNRMYLPYSTASK